MTSILVTGTHGQVATALKSRASGAENVQVVCVGRPDFDLALPQSLDHIIEDYRPTLVVNAAAWTAVDDAENNKVAAFEINANGAGRVASSAKRFNTPVIQLSTDYVFSGEKTGAYSELDTPDPKSVYGSSKLEGERRVASANSKHIILRTAWVYSATGKNFLKTMLRLAETRNELAVVSDQIGTPTYAGSIADAIICISERLAKAPSDECYGIFHLTNTGYGSWYNFAEEIFRQSSLLGGSTASVKPISSSEYPTKAKRPQNSRLLCQKLSDIYDLRLPHWQVPVADVVKSVLNGQ